MSASVSRLLPLLGGLRGTLGGSSGMERRGGGSRFEGAALLLLERRFEGAATLSLAPLDIFFFFFALLCESTAPAAAAATAP